MTEAVIVSTARTPIGRAFRGALNNVKSPTLMAHAIKHAVSRTSIEEHEIDDVLIGTVLTGGTAGSNVARLASLAAGLPCTVSAQTIDRQCSSGLMAIATAARQIMVDGMQVCVAGGQDNISAVQQQYLGWVAEEIDPNVTAMSEHAYMPMLKTAEYVASKYSVSREQQDEYSLESQQRTAAAQQAGLFDDEIVAISATKKNINRETKEVTLEDITLSKDEGNRPETTLDGLQSLKPVIEGGCITAGNASQLSDGASACVVMNSKLAEQRLSLIHI